MTLPLAAAILALPRPQFAGLDYQSVETGELARYSVILTASTETLYRKDIAILEAVEKHRALLSPLFQDAVSAILASRRKSLTAGIGNREDYTNKDTYTHVGNGLKVHNVTGALYVTGLVNSKSVITPATQPRKVPNSAPLVKAKRDVEARFSLPSRKFRTFKLEGVKGARVNGDIITFY